MTPQEEMRQIFFDSTAELLQKLNEEALRLETHAQDREAAREIRRIVHTIKGDSAVLGFRELSELAHELEDVLAPDSMSAVAGLAEVVLSAADMFDAMLVAYQAGVQPPSGDPLRSLIWNLAGRVAPQSSRPALQPKFAWNDRERSAADAATARQLSVFNIAVRLAPECPMREAGAELLHHAVQGCGEVLACAPEFAQWAESECIEAVLATQLDEEILSAKLFVPGVAANLVVQRWSASPESAAAGSVARSEVNDAQHPGDEGHVSSSRSRKADENLLRVDAARVDALLSLVGELVIGKSMLQQAINDFSRRHPKDPVRAQLADSLAMQSQTLRALQRAVMGIRMVPVEQLFRTLPRLVRDVARSCGKQVVLETSGRETELDKALVDALAEPLGHIVRNAVDHGIESPALRRAAGKPESGNLRLNAFHEGNQMVIEVSDDGRGIDREAVVRRAIERGLVSAEQAGTLEANEIVDLIFEPGFSTAAEVTAISGRGVGMDVVKTAVRKLKGAVTVESTPGRGSTVRIKLPLTLAIMRSMLFRVAGNLYAVPLDMVLEIGRAQEQEFTRAGNREVFQVRDELVTVVRLQRMHGSEHCSSPLSPQERSFILVLNVGQRKYALTVDAVVGEQELVIKPLDEKTIASALVSGASVLGDGTVAQVLNVEEVVRRYAGLAIRDAVPGDPNSESRNPNGEWSLRA